MEDKKEIIKKLIKLQDLTNKIIDELQKEKDAFHEAINWGNLYCIEASFCINQEGFEYYNVLIHEASPSAMMFRDEISGRLMKNLHEVVMVQTEW